MGNRYRCPNCKTNRTRFNVIEQVAYAAKFDPDTGEMVERYETEEEAGPLHKFYDGPKRRLQCAVCGVNEQEEMFIKFGES